MLLPAFAFAAAIVLLVLGIEPVPTWFYVFAWYPTLLILDETAHRLGHQPRVLRDPATVLSLFGWSVVIWLVFEAANFRLDNWYYVFLPKAVAERWAGILLSFATVVPAVVLSERALAAAGFATRWTTKPVRVRNIDLTGSVILGLGMLALSLAWPRLFFPLIWGATFLLAESYVYRRRPDLSLFGDLERGHWGRAARLLAGGLAIGLLWESYNYWARGKWVYTVPSLEGTKWFEMPPFGFVGFGFFALEAWSMYQALCAAGVARSLSAPRPLAPRRATLAAVAAVAFSVTTLTGMERWTISSVAPTFTDLPESGGSITRLAMLKGMGTVHAARLQALGIADVCSLAREDPGRLWSRIHAAHDGKRPTRAEVRVWVGGAALKC